MNKAILIGRITKDLSPRQVKAGNGTISCVQFTVAVDRRFKDKDGNRQADFINCVAWRQQADFIAKYFSKGSKIAIVGTLQSRSYDDKDGKKVYVVEVLVEEADFVESKNGGNAPQQKPAPAPSIDEANDDIMKDMPFEF